MCPHGISIRGEIEKPGCDNEPDAHYHHSPSSHSENRRSMCERQRTYDAADNPRVPSALNSPSAAHDPRRDEKGDCEDEIHPVLRLFPFPIRVAITTSKDCS